MEHPSSRLLLFHGAHHNRCVRPCKHTQSILYPHLRKWTAFVSKKVSFYRLAHISRNRNLSQYYKTVLMVILSERLINIISLGVLFHDVTFWLHTIILAVETWDMSGNRWRLKPLKIQILKNKLKQVRSHANSRLPTYFSSVPKQTPKLMTDKAELYRIMTKTF